MKIRLKGAKKDFLCTEPVEQKLFASGNANGWVLIFTVLEDLSSTDVDNSFTSDAISRITFTKDDESAIVIEGYERIASCSVRHKENSPCVEIQLAKGV